MELSRSELSLKDLWIIQNMTLYCSPLIGANRSYIMKRVFFLSHLLAWGSGFLALLWECAVETAINLIHYLRKCCLNCRVGGHLTGSTYVMFWNLAEARSVTNLVLHGQNSLVSYCPSTYCRQTFGLFGWKSIFTGRIFQKTCSLPRLLIDSAVLVTHSP